MKSANTFDNLKQFIDPDYNEHEAFTKYKNGEVSLDYILTQNYKLCFKYINKYFLDVDYLTYDDKLSIAAQGLMKAIKTFKPEKGYTFSTYAYKVIFSRFLNEIRDIKKVKRIKYTSLDAKMCNELNDESDLTFVNQLVDEYANVSKQAENRVLLGNIKDLLGKLKQHEREVMEMRYFKGLSQDEVARVRGCTQGNVSHIERKVLGYLRKKLVI